MVNIPYINTDLSGLSSSSGAESYDYEDDYDDDYAEEEEENTITPEYQYIYFYLPSEFQRAFTFVTPAGSYGEVFGGESMRSLLVGKFAEGSSAMVSLTLESTNLYVTKDVPLFYYLDYNAYLNVVEELSKNQLVIDDGFKDDHITGTITTTGEKSTVFTSIPYDEGWIVKVDGKEVDIFGALPDSSFEDKNATEGAVIAFNINSEGEHTVELKYRPKEFVLGAAISVVGVALLVLLIIFEKKINIVSEKILFPLVIPVKHFSGEDESSKDQISDAAPEVNVADGLEAATPLNADRLEIAEPAVSIDGEASENESDNEENGEN